MEQLPSNCQAQGTSSNQKTAFHNVQRSYNWLGKDVMLTFPAQDPPVDLYFADSRFIKSVSLLSKDSDSLKVPTQGPQPPP